MESVLRERLGNLKQERKQLDELEVRSASDRKTLADVVERENVYRQLVKAFGRRGVPAMLIEESIPQL